jgi:hypothetical protein
MITRRIDLLSFLPRMGSVPAGLGAALDEADSIARLALDTFSKLHFEDIQRVFIHKKVVNQNNVIQIVAYNLTGRFPIEIPYESHSDHLSRMIARIYSLFDHFPS